MANWNPHIHALITDTCWNREGNCNPMTETETGDIRGIEKLFAGLVFRMLLEETMIAEELVDNMNSWKHSGFSVYCAEPIEACDDNGRKTLSEYISRTPFSLERMSFRDYPGTTSNWISRFQQELKDSGLQRGTLSSHSCQELRCCRFP